MPAQLAGVGDEFDPARRREQALVLRHEADDLADVERPAADVDPQHGARPGIDPDQPHQRPDHRGLARPVRAEQADRPLGRRDGQVAKRRDGP